MKPIHVFSIGIMVLLVVGFLRYAGSGKLSHYGAREREVAELFAIPPGTPECSDTVAPPCWSRLSSSSIGASQICSDCIGVGEITDESLRKAICVDEASKLFVPCPRDTEAEEAEALP